MKNPEKPEKCSNVSRRRESITYESRNESRGFHVRVNSSCQLLTAIHSVLRLINYGAEGESPPRFTFTHFYQNLPPPPGDSPPSPVIR